MIGHQLIEAYRYSERVPSARIWRPPGLTDILAMSSFNTRAEGKMNTWETTADVGQRFLRFIEELKSRAHTERIRSPDVDKNDPASVLLHAFTVVFALNLYPGNPLDDAITTGFARTGLDSNDPLHWKLLLGAFCLAHFSEVRKVGAPRTWTRSVLRKLLDDVEGIQSRRQALDPLTDSAIAEILITTPQFAKAYGHLGWETIRERIREARMLHLEFLELQKKYLASVELAHSAAGIDLTPTAAKDAQDRFRDAFWGDQEG